MGDKVGENPAARSAAVSSLSSENLRGRRAFKRPTSRARVKKGPSHLGKHCYIRDGCVPMDKFDATDYESAFRFDKNCLVLEKRSFDLLNIYWLRNVI